MGGSPLVFLLSLASLDLVAFRLDLSELLTISKDNVHVLRERGGERERKRESQTQERRARRIQVTLSKARNWPMRILPSDSVTFIR